MPGFLAPLPNGAATVPSVPVDVVADFICKYITSTPMIQPRTGSHCVREPITYEEKFGLQPAPPQVMPAVPIVLVAAEIAVLPTAAQIAAVAVELKVVAQYEP